MGDKLVMQAEQPVGQTEDKIRQGRPEARRRRTLQRKVILSIVLLVVLSTGVCGYVTMWVSGRMLRESMSNNARLLADAAARTVAAEAKVGHANTLAHPLEGMAVDTRVAFIVVTDPSGNTVARRITRPLAWSTFQGRSGTQLFQPTDVGRTIAIDTDGDELFVYTEPVWLRGRMPRASDDELLGYLTLAMIDPTAARLGLQIKLAMVGCVLLIGLLSALPVAWAVRRWTKPLRQMAREARRLTSGRKPKLINDQFDDEVGLLVEAFNTMVIGLTDAREQLEQTNAELEKKVRQRTSALQLINDQLEMQMRDKDEFIRAVTHDLNAPLRNIAGMTKVLLRKHADSMTDTMRTKLERIEANVQNEAEMLSDLLDLSRVRTEPGHDQPLELTPLVKQVIGSLDYEIDAKGIDVRIETPLPVLVADRSRIRQVFQNLIDNAIKYMPTDAVSKRVRIGCVDQSGRCEFYVTDTGRGIAQEDHDRVFQVFQRARYSGDHDTEGRGVGLASVKSIIEGYGGRITIDPPNAAAPGTTFRFTVAPQHIGQPAPSLQSAQSAR